MKVLITGRSGLAESLRTLYGEHDVDCVSRQDGHDIACIRSWGQKFLHYDIVYNCAYDGLGQIAVLEFFHQHWKHDQSKTIVNVGSRVTYFPRSESKTDYWDYRLHKQALQLAFEQMSSDARCSIKLINPGPIDTDMTAHLSVPKLDPDDLAIRIKSFTEDHTIRRVDLWV